MTLMVDLKDRGVDPTEGSGNPYHCHLEIDDESRLAIVVWTEFLAFHAERNGPAKGWYASTEDDWAPLVDENGWLTEGAERRVAIRLADILKDSVGYTLTVDTYYGPDEPSVVIEVAVPYRDGDTYEEWLDRIGWPVVATLIQRDRPRHVQQSLFVRRHGTGERNELMAAIWTKWGFTEDEYKLNENLSSE